MKYLPADPHVQFSFINRNATWSQVLSELVDNAFDPDGGNATSIEIELHRDGSVSALDYGRGIEDVNALAQLGNSGTYIHDGNLGQYGVGSKTWLCKAICLKVETIRNGLFHKHTFDTKLIHEAYKNKTKPLWLQAYEGSGKKTSRPSFSRMTLCSMRPNVGLINIVGIKNDLSRNYWPGIKRGFKITVIDDRKQSRFKEPQIILQLEPPSWENVIEFESEINGKKYRAKIGILSENIGAYSGIWIGFLYRNICIEKQLSTRAVPARIHAQIELLDGWRHSFTPLKNAIAVDHDELMEDIEKNAKKILDLAEEYAEDFALENISAIIEGKISLALMRTMYRKQKPSHGPGPLPVSNPDRPIPDIVEPKTGNEEPKHQPKRTGVKLQWEHLGTDITSTVKIENKTVTVILNRDCRKLMALRLQPAYPGLFLAMGNAIAMHCLELSPAQIEVSFQGMLGTSEGSEDRYQMMRSIVTWWGFVAEEVQDEEKVA